MIRRLVRRDEKVLRPGVAAGWRAGGMAVLLLTMLLPAMLVSAPAIVARPAMAASNPPPVPAEKPLTSAQIIQLLNGKTYRFTAYGRPLTGTTHWDIAAHTVSGSYNYAGIFRGSYQAEWNVVDDKSCTRDEHQGLLCLTIYAYGSGFMEVTSKGEVHSISEPQ
ncbi:MAG TPA: hypothetical protein VM639_12295 [Dongiaceae bacterium]|nr:hypothetical protein [Dongiaceae bacterium]